MVPWGWDCGRGASRVAGGGEEGGGGGAGPRVPARSPAIVPARESQIKRGGWVTLGRWQGRRPGGRGAGQQPKRRRGRPRKAPGAAQAGRSAGEAGQGP